MIRFKRTNHYRLLIIGGLLAVFFLYFDIFNRYHILSLEQSQLFLFNFNFIIDTFSHPGGLPLYLGSFFTQFFISSWAGALIITFCTSAAFLLSHFIYNKHNIKSIIPAIVPVWLLLMLQSNELFIFGQYIGALLLLLFFAIYISIRNSGPRYLFYISGWPVFYFLAGGFSIPAIIMCLIHELLFRKHDYSRIILAFYILEGALIPYVAHLLFYIPLSKIFTYPVILELNSYTLFIQILLLFWIPLVLAGSYSVNKLNPSVSKLLTGKISRVVTGVLIFVAMGLGVFKFGYNKNTELLLGIDYNAQHQEWEKVLELSAKNPYPNRLVIYYTNLALYKTGQLLDKMFSYPQTGSDGLRLKWERNSTLIFGGEVFYYLSYTNEAARWAFEAMVAKGLNPRVLKRLVATSIINSENEIAKKYLNLLNQTLFYRKFTEQQIAYLNNSALAEKDPDIERNRAFLIHSDFVSNPFDLNLFYLLTNHPENNMAYEYLMASLLLDKRLDAFTRVFAGFKDYGYTSIPVHVEEALLLHSLHENINLLPEGYSIRPETIRRFKDYGAKFAANKGDREAAAKVLREEYGNTYWYYVQFINNK